MLFSNYSFNGKEKDDEWSGDGNFQDYGERMYDNRLGRFLSVDPLSGSFPWYTPYQFAGNEPISNIDLDGLEKLNVTRSFNAKGNNYSTLIKVIDAKAALSISYENLYDTDPTQTPLKIESEQNLQDFVTSQEKSIFTSAWNNETKEFKEYANRTPESVQFGVPVPTEEPASYNLDITFADIWEDEEGFSALVNEMTLTNNNTGDVKVLLDVSNQKNGLANELDKNNPGVKELKKVVGTHKTNTEIKTDAGTFPELGKKLQNRIVSVLKATINSKLKLTSDSGEHNIRGEGGHNVTVGIDIEGGEIDNSATIPKGKTGG